MHDPALVKSIQQLAAVVERLNQESDTLNSRISEFETMLVTINPGIAVWAAKPIRLKETDGTGSQVGFLKWKETWGLWVLRGRFVKSGDGWKVLESGERTVVRLVDATREERVAAFDRFPGIVDTLTKEAKARLALLEAANKRVE